MRYLIRSTFIAVCVVLAACRFSFSSQLIDKIVAVVDEEAITQTELEESMHPFVADYKTRYGEEGLAAKIEDVRKDALNRLIEEKLILEEAKRLKVEVDDEEVYQKLEEIKKRFPSEEAFEKTLADSGMTLAKLKEKYKEQLMIRALVSQIINKKVHITPTQVAAYYYGHKSQFASPMMIRFKILMLKPTKEMSLSQTEYFALTVLDKIKAGENFDILVKQYSQGPYVEKGGDMGFMPEHNIVAEIRKEVITLAPGAVSGVIKMPAGFCIVKVEEKKDPVVQSLVEATPSVRERLFQRESELVLREYVNKLRKGAYIKINETI